MIGSVKIFIITLLALLGMLGQASFADDIVGNVTTNIREPLTITENIPMDFGIILVDPAGDDIRMRPNNNITAINGSTSVGGSPTSGRFRAEGSANTSVSYSFSTGDVLSGPGTDIEIIAFQLNRSNPFTLNNSGRRNFRVGATIRTAPNQLSGVYTGTYTLTINYE